MNEEIYAKKQNRKCEKYTNQVLKNMVLGDEIGLAVEFNEIDLEIALLWVIENREKWKPQRIENWDNIVREHRELRIENWEKWKPQPPKKKVWVRENPSVVMSLHSAFF